MQQAQEPGLFVIISFEGPDRWSQAGGLGVRVTGLADTLAERGHDVEVFFMGDPELPGEEQHGRVTLHRWGQWISRFHRSGVYDGEEWKRTDLNASLPAYVIERVLIPAIRAGRMPIVLLEEWQTAECATLISDGLMDAGVRDRVVIAWNANNAYSFDRIDWPRLAVSSTITTVSRYMRSIIRARGIDAIVIPNGIPDRLTRPVERPTVMRLRAAFGGRPFFFKMARWGSDKGWAQALGAIGLLHRRGRDAVLVARSGGPAATGNGLDELATTYGLRVRPIHNERELHEAASYVSRDETDVLSLRFGVEEQLARTIFAASDGVLANSVSEPFGLIGLEAMAAGALVYTGGTGEDYAVSGTNAVVLETLDPVEIADHAEELEKSPRRAQRIRRAARLSARNYLWHQTTRSLFWSLALQARRQGHKLALLNEDAACPN